MIVSLFYMFVLKMYMFIYKVVLIHKTEHDWLSVTLGIYWMYFH